MVKSEFAAPASRMSEIFGRERNTHKDEEDDGGCEVLVSCKQACQRRRLKVFCAAVGFSCIVQKHESSKGSMTHLGSLR